MRLPLKRRRPAIIIRWRAAVLQTRQRSRSDAESIDEDDLQLELPPPLSPQQAEAHARTELCDPWSRINACITQTLPLATTAAQCERAIEESTPADPSATARARELEVAAPTLPDAATAADSAEGSDRAAATAAALAAVREKKRAQQKRAKKLRQRLALALMPPVGAEPSSPKSPMRASGALGSVQHARLKRDALKLHALLERARDRVGVAEAAAQARELLRAHTRTQHECAAEFGAVLLATDVLSALVPPAAPPLPLPPPHTHPSASYTLPRH
jgi:hypothetical protein